MKLMSSSLDSCRQRGSAMITVMFFVVLISLVAGNVFVMARQDIVMGHRIVNRTNAQQIAVGAASRALGYLANDVANVTSPPSALATGNMGDGTYDVTINRFGVNNFEIISTGTVNDVARTVRVYGSYPLDVKKAFGKAFLSNADLSLNGGGAVRTNLQGGDVHSNQNSNIGGNVQLDGEATAAGIINVFGAATVAGDPLSGSDPIAFPQLDFDHYYAIAQANGQIYHGDVNLDGSYSPAGGVMWINGNVNTKSNVTFNGMLIATGDINQASHFVQTKYESFPAMASRNGNIRLSGQTIIDGLIMAQTGAIDITGGSAITGSVMAWGNIKTIGNWGVIYFAQEEPKLANAGNNIHVFAWETMLSSQLK